MYDMAVAAPINIYEILILVNTLMIAPLYWILSGVRKDIDRASQNQLEIVGRLAHIEGELHNGRYREPVKRNGPATDH